MPAKRKADNGIGDDPSLKRTTKDSTASSTSNTQVSTSTDALQPKRKKKTKSQKAAEIAGQRKRIAEAKAYMQSSSLKLWTTPTSDSSNRMVYMAQEAKTKGKKSEQVTDEDDARNQSLPSPVPGVDWWSPYVERDLESQYSEKYTAEFTFESEVFPGNLRHYKYTNASMDEYLDYNEIVGNTKRIKENGRISNKKHLHSGFHVKNALRRRNAAE
ncbi:hypothetical protein N0V90_003421 [Kalmusia sp. IMI 367209]|nr:hypothetical protein N0V90_003421 [Kalmusia sp. IMI 367209]